MNKKLYDEIKDRYENLDYETIADLHGRAVKSQDYSLIRETTCFAFHNGFYFERDDISGCYQVKCIEGGTKMETAEDLLDIALGITAARLLEQGYPVTAYNLYDNVDDITLEQCETWLAKENEDARYSHS